MPIYDYVCSSCGHRTEVIHGINDPAPRFCPSCGAEGTLRKGFSTPAILFKGSGWAKKDRAATRTPKSSKPSDPRDAGSGSSSGSSAGSAAGGETGGSKPASKPDGGSTSTSSSGGSD